MSELDVLRAADFDWAMHLSDVWNDSPRDVPELHTNIRAEYVAKLEAMRASADAKSPLGWVIVGGGGTGKTHLLGFFRREAVRQRAAFVMVDMTDVRDFWETVLQGYLDSLQVRYEGDLFQYQWLLRNLIERLGPKQPISKALSILTHNKSTQLRAEISAVLNALALQFGRKEALAYQNVVRALVCLNGVDFSISSLGMTWLQGQEIEAEDKSAFGFTIAREHPLKIVEGLSWLMSLSGPTILAFDQLDPIVTQLDFQKSAELSPEESAAAKAIVALITGGLMTLRDKTRKTLSVVSCLETTWKTLQTSALQPAVDRFEFPQQLDSIKIGTIAEAVVRNRLAQAFAKTGFSAPYPTWPFRLQAFEKIANITPREVLKKCQFHRQHCLDKGVVDELDSYARIIEPPAPTPLLPPFGLLDEH